jgi:hypothetical protein
VILGCCGSSSASTGIKKSSVNTLMMRCCSWSSRLISPPIRFYDVGDQRELKSFSRRRRKPLSYCDATLSPRLVHPGTGSRGFVDIKPSQSTNIIDTVKRQKSKTMP